MVVGEQHREIGAAGFQREDDAILAVGLDVVDVAEKAPCARFAVGTAVVVD